MAASERSLYDNVATRIRAEWDGLKARERDSIRGCFFMVQRQLLYPLRLISSGGMFDPNEIHLTCDVKQEQQQQEDGAMCVACLNKAEPDADGRLSTVALKITLVCAH